MLLRLSSLRQYRNLSRLSLLVVAYGRRGYRWPIFNRMRNNTWNPFEDKLKDNGSWQSVYQEKGKKTQSARSEFLDD